MSTSGHHHYLCTNNNTWVCVAEEWFQLPKNGQHLSRPNSWNMLQFNGIFDLPMSQCRTHSSVQISKQSQIHWKRNFWLRLVWVFLSAFLAAHFGLLPTRDRIRDGCLAENLMLVNYVKLRIVIIYHKCYDSYAKNYPSIYHYPVSIVSGDRSVLLHLYALMKIICFASRIL